MQTRRSNNGASSKWQRPIVTTGIVVVLLFSSTFSAATDFDTGAIALCEERVHFLQCNDSIIMALRLGGKLKVEQYKGGKVVAIARKLSKADLLNGVEWRGVVSVESTSLYRVRPLGQMAWGEWQDAGDGFGLFGGGLVLCSLEYKNGRWTGSTSSPYSHLAVPFDCHQALIN